MSRREFSKETKRLAFERSGGFCEGSGPAYGLPPGQRCNAPLDRGVIYDHEDPDYIGKNNSLENCRCICPQACNKFKTYKHDAPKIAKVDRLLDRQRGIKKTASQWPSRRLPTKADRRRFLARMAAREEARR
ncbi:MAG TPA: HNH endonuclease [Rhizomicrobium sp.]|nr:HNH endonuclease [Rhizomicrobium sp.]